MEEAGLCDTKFWDFDLFWNNEVPQLTSCFRQGALVLIPNAIFGLICLLKIGKMYCWKSQGAQNQSYFKTVVYIFKLFFSVLLIGGSLVKLIYITSFARPVPNIEIYAEVVRFITYVFILLLQILQRYDGLLNSTFVFLFWLVSSLCGFFTSPIFDVLSDNVNERTEFVGFVVDSIAYPVVLMQLVLSVFSDPAYKSVFVAEKDDHLIKHQPILSRLLFSWLDRLISYGYRNEININDIDTLSPEHRSANIYESLIENWKPRKKGRTDEHQTKKRSSSTSLFWAVSKTLMPMLLTAACLEVMYSCIILVPPLILDLMIGFVENAEEAQWHGYVYAVGLFLAEGAGSLLLVHDLYFLVLASLVPRMGLTAAIYRKCLKLSGGARRKYTVGELCNLVAVDAQKVFELLWMINLVWSAPLRIILIVIVLWQYLGIACLVGISTMIFLMPITGYLTRKTHKLQEEQMTRKDLRLRQMGEILNGIKILKLFAWEIPFMEQISAIRNKEITTIKKMAFLHAGLVFQWGIAPFLVAISSFVAFVLLDESNVLDASVAFVSLSLFNSLNFAFDVIPDVITDIVECRVSFRRLEAFLASEELKENAVGHQVPKGDAVSIDGANFSWSAGEDPFLCDVSLAFPVGALAAVVGSVGSGKSALLSAILGEMHLTGGHIDVMEGKIAYVAQQAWIQNATLQENILFLNKMNPSRYQDVLDRCCLKRDLEILPAGDQTEIGEKGVNLSGGQKQRVSMARALYQDADIYLLDDPLSAVDAHVGSEMFEKVIGQDGLLNKKTRIWVTHDLAILPEVDVIFVMSNGRIIESGTYQKLVHENDGSSALSKMVEEHLKNLQNADADVISEIPDSPEVDIPTEVLKDQMKRAGSRISRTISVQDLPTTSKLKENLKLIEKEKMETGGVKPAVFLSYFQHASYISIGLMICSFIIFEAFEVGSNVWLSNWSNDAASGRGHDIGLRNLRIGVYGLLGLGQALFILLASLLLAIASTRASRILHHHMLRSIMRSPLAFFERTPVGRILNRFGKDVNVVDSNVPVALENLMSSSTIVIGTIIIISITNAIFIAVIIPIAIFYVIVQSYYMNTSRQARRIQSVTLSPVMSNLSETVQGASTIRAFGAEQTFIHKEDALVDLNTRAFFCSSLLNRWLSVRLEMMGCVIILSVALFAVFGRDTMNPGLVGLTLSYALKATEVLTALVKSYTNLEMRMVSVERIDEYSELQSEASWVNKDDEVAVPKDWPAEGRITFDNYKLRYQKVDNFALEKLDVNIEPCQKVGVVGRTGAGKSSLTVALFRIVEPAAGTIAIDGVDVATLGLHHLRSKLTIIPQDPILFSGSIRLNLDPFNVYSDEELWLALEHSHLKNFVTNLGLGLQYNVAEGGENLSVGQRQQLCLARALLKKTKILVLDEATAAVDMETDRLIQSTIRTEFGNCTIVTIAHRLYTILDYDRILVMDNGKVVEDGKPDYLLQKKDSKFYQLAKDAGLL